MHEQEQESWINKYIYSHRLKEKKREGESARELEIITIIIIYMRG